MFQDFRLMHVACALILPLFVAVSCTSASVKNREESGLRLQIGTSHMLRGNYPAALRELLEAERLDPKNPVVQNNLGLVYFFREKFDTALEKLDRAIKLEPKYTEARNNHARVLIEMTRYDEAIAELNVVLQDLTYDEPQKAWVNLGLAHFRKGDFKGARERLAEAIKLERDNCLAQTLYGRTLLELGQLATAAQTLDNAVVVCKTGSFDEPRYFSGLTYYKLGKTSSAIARMEEVVKLYPQGKYAQKAQSMLQLMK